MKNDSIFCNGALHFIDTGCDDCGDCGLQAKLECTLDPGNYIVVVDGFSALEGDFILEMTCSGGTVTLNLPFLFPFYVHG